MIYYRRDRAWSEIASFPIIALVLLAGCLVDDTTLYLGMVSSPSSPGFRNDFGYDGPAGWPTTTPARTLLVARHLAQLMWWCWSPWLPSPADDRPPTRGHLGCYPVADRPAVEPWPVPHREAGHDRGRQAGRLRALRLAPGWIPAAPVPHWPPPLVVPGSLPALPAAFRLCLRLHGGAPGIYDRVSPG